LPESVVDCSLFLFLVPAAMNDRIGSDFRLGQLVGLASGLAAACTLQLLSFIFL
jgi:hypothetical protein